MGWSTFWIGDFVLRGGARPIETRVPSLEAGELEWVFYDGSNLHVRRVADRDADTGEADYTQLFADVKAAGGTGRLACIAWEDGPATFGFEYELDGVAPRALGEKEIAALFEANAEAMRAVLEDPEAASAFAPTLPKAGKAKKAASKAKGGADGKAKGGADAKATPPARDAKSLLAATAKGSNAKRAEALEALAEIDLPAALEIAHAWIHDADLEDGGWSWKGGKAVAKGHMRPAAARVLGKDPSDASLDALVIANRLFGGPTTWAVREALAAWTRPGIAERLGREMHETKAEVDIKGLLTTLVQRREVGDEDLLGRMARDPKGAGVVIYGADVTFQLDIVRALVAAGTGGAPSLIDVLCDLLSTETFSVYDTRIESMFENDPDRGPAIARALLASPRFPRAGLSAEVLGAIEKMAARG